MIRLLACSCANTSLTPLSMDENPNPNLNSNLNLNLGMDEMETVENGGRSVPVLVGTLELQEYISSGRLGSVFRCKTSDSISTNVHSHHHHQQDLVAKIIDLGAIPSVITVPNTKTNTNIDNDNDDQLDQAGIMQAIRNEIRTYTHLIDLQGIIIPRFHGAFRGIRSYRGFASEIVVLVMDHLGPMYGLSALTDQERYVYVYMRGFHIQITYPVSRSINHPCSISIRP